MHKNTQQGERQTSVRSNQGPSSLHFSRGIEISIESETGNTQGYKIQLYRILYAQLDSGVPNEM